MPFHFRSISSWTCMFLAIFFFLAGCRKTDLSISNNDMQTQTYEQLQTRFFNTTGTDPEIQKLAANFQKHESVFKFLPEFVKKNGIARWDKVIYQVKNQSPEVRSSMSNSRSSINDNNGEEISKGVFLVPLQSTTSPEIKSYITAYKHSDSTYTYRVYNKDSLSQIHPSSLQAKNNLLNTQAVLGYFEKSINNKDSIQVVSPGNGNIKNVEISFGNTGQQGGGRSSGNVASSTSSLTCESTIYITILYEWHDYSLSYEGDGAWVAVAMYSETVINCFETGGSGSGSGNYYDPYGGSGGGGNYYDPYGGGTNNWWDYGTGWPYGGGTADPFNPYYDPYSDPNNPYYDPNNYTDWYPWWTGGGGGSNYTLEIFPDDSILGNYFDNDADFTIDDYDNTNYAQYESNQQWPIVNSIIPLSMFVEYDRRDCFILSQEQIGKLGYKISSYNAPGQTIQIYNEHIGIDIQAAKNGVSYLLSALQRGIPVIVGVDYKNSTYAPGRPDGSTDHFVVIVGSGSDSQGNYFTFYDNASNYDSKGASSLNKLYYNPTTGFIQGQTQVTYDNGSKMPAYTVTQIRKSK